MTLELSALWIPAAGLGASLALAAATWAASVVGRDVSIVDIAWGFLVLVPAAVVALLLPATGPRAPIVLGLAFVWALRLSAYIAWRHRGQPEDRRYQEIRARNEPHFEWKSVYLVFGLQALLAWIVSAPLMAAVASPVSLGALDATGLAVALAGLGFETLADLQLARFKADRRNRGRVMDRGLWRHSRHPNYFGECVVWWGFWIAALGAGAWWSVVSPLLMTLLLVRISGVPLLEKDLGRQRPGYAEYIRRTPAFVPWRVRT